MRAWWHIVAIVATVAKVRGILESGPPESLVQSFSTVFAQKIQDTRVAAQQAKERLGW